MSGVAPTSALPWLAAAGGLLALGAAPELLLGRRSHWGPRITTALTMVASLLGLGGAILAMGGARSAVTFPSPVPGLRVELGADPLTGFFALPIFLVGGLGALYGAAYWSPRRHRRSGPRLRFSYGLLLASLTAVTLARDFVSLLVAWEVMTVATFLVVTTEDENPAARRAGWIFLLYSHAAILALFALLVVVWQLCGGVGFTTIPAAAPAALQTAAFVLALIGFGIKAGLMPLHFWLPGAHATAPSHVSAVMSGVVIKMGIYGLVRTCGLFAAPAFAWGATLLALGAVASFFGVAFALGQHDLKRLLAYHSIENIGIIAAGARAGDGRPLARQAGLGGAGPRRCLLHVWNHALFKSLLFFGAGSVVHATGTRDIEQSGGLAKRMPWTAGFFLLGAVAICGLPPLNGFVSELLVYLGLLRAAIGPGGGLVRAASPRRLLAADRRARGGLLRQGLRRRLPRYAAHGGRRARPRVAPAMLGPMAVLAPPAALIGLAPALDRSGARPRRRQLGAAVARRRPAGGPGALRLGLGGRRRAAHPDRRAGRGRGAGVPAGPPPAADRRHLGLRLRRSSPRACSTPRPPSPR